MLAVNREETVETIVAMREGSERQEGAALRGA